MMSVYGEEGNVTSPYNYFADDNPMISLSLSGEMKKNVDSQNQAQGQGNGQGQPQGGYQFSGKLGRKIRESLTSGEGLGEGVKGGKKEQEGLKGEVGDRNMANRSRTNVFITSSTMANSNSNKDGSEEGEIRKRTALNKIGKREISRCTDYEFQQIKIHIYLLFLI